MMKTKSLHKSISSWTIVSVFVLTLQNLLIFRSHYFANLGIPWDFPMSYFPWVAFWTAAMDHGVFPSWVPFQSMGYPFVLQLQAALFYPPFYIFPLFNIDHTYQASVAVQCLHVLAGSIGMFLLLRVLVRDLRLALLGAFIFQFFGGFYGNAQHSDIIRSFALTPWALFCFTFLFGSGNSTSVSDEQKTSFFPGLVRRIQSIVNAPCLPLRAFFIPLVLFFYATGGYPGNYFAILFILAIYVAAQLIQVFFINRSFSQVFSIGLVLFILTGLGISMAAIQLGPSWLFRNEFSRLDNFQALEKVSIWIPQLPGLFLSSKTLPGEISETSTFVTLPALIFACFLLGSTIKKYWPIALIGLVSTLMIAGDYSFFYRAVTKVVFPLALSRFPTSDYRALVAIPLIIFAVLGLQDLFQNRWKTGSLLIRVGFIALWFFQGLYMAYWHPVLVQSLSPKDTLYRLFSWTGLSSWAIHIFFAVTVFLITLGLLFLLFKVQRRLSTLVVVLLVGMVFVDGMRVITDMETWRDPTVLESYYVQAIPQFVDNEFAPQRIFDHLPAMRPARKQVGHTHWFSWRGYMDGSYMMQDYKACPTSSCNHIEANPVYHSYMLKAWDPILLSEGWTADGTNGVTISDAVISQAVSRPEGTQTEVIQTFYGLDKIRYQVKLDQPKLMIENETYFPGWEAELRSGATNERIHAIVVNKAFRAWQLPAGQYEMEADFHFPYFNTLIAISLASFIFWLVILFLRVFFSRKLNTSPALSI